MHADKRIAAHKHTLAAIENTLTRHEIEREKIIEELKEREGKRKNKGTVTRTVREQRGKKVRQQRDAAEKERLVRMSKKSDEVFENTTILNQQRDQRHASAMRVRTMARELCSQQVRGDEERRFKALRRRLDREQAAHDYHRQFCDDVKDKSVDQLTSLSSHRLPVSEYNPFKQRTDAKRFKSVHGRIRPSTATLVRLSDKLDNYAGGSNVYYSFRVQ